MVRRKYKSITKEIEVDIDVDLSDFDTDDLIEELKSRNVNWTENPDLELEDIYKQFAFNNEQKAISLTKKYIEQTLGKTLN